MMGACGLNCSSCEIRLAPEDTAAAKVVIDWFKSQGWLSEGEGMEEVLQRKMYCKGCLGDRQTHWSSDCWILQCCADQHGYANCSECGEFPCDRLVAWSGENDSYKKALTRLKQLRTSSSHDTPPA
jgi:hypothetical protein